MIKSKEEREERAGELYEANRPRFRDWGTLKQMCIATAIQYADEWASQFPSQGLRELAQLQEEYISFLTDAYRKVEVIANIHGFAWDEESLKRGKELREKISLAKITSTPDGSQKKFKYNPENGYWWDENGTPFLSEELSEIISGSQGLREWMDKNEKIGDE